MYLCEVLQTVHRLFSRRLSEMEKNWRDLKEPVSWADAFLEFLPYVYLVPAGTSIPVSISAVSSNSKCSREGKTKRHQKKETSSCFCLCSFYFWGVFSNSWIMNDICRNFLLGNRKKIAQCLRKTFTCCSTLLYGRGALQCTGWEEGWLLVYDRKVMSAFRLYIL